MKKFIAIFFVLILLAFVASFFWYKSSLKPVEVGSEVRQTYKVAKGSSVAVISSSLVEKNLINSALAFKIYVKLNKMESELQAGSFVLKKSLSIPEIAQILKTGKAEEMIITIPEGYTVKDIDSLLAQKDLITAGDFIKCATECDFSEYDFLPDLEGLTERGGRIEGYLYPDTYFVTSEGFSSQKFAERLLNKFQIAVADGMSEYLNKSERSIQQIVVMASLIEKESRADEERPEIAGILWKRFDEGMGLGVDASVRYITNKPTEPITLADLNDNSPYNTRKFKGLPPGAIANPGFKSIEAALSPKDTNYWYYLHDSNGDIHYAISNEEHNLNRYKYLK